MPHRVLNEDWSNYDNRKIRDSRDSRFFSCEEQWEVDYLLEKVHRHLTHKTEAEIKDAILKCCKIIKTPRPRSEFVKCVFDRLDPKTPQDPPKPPKSREVGK